jgi:hypothetical protein
MPKLNLFYTMEDFLQKQMVVIDSENKSDRWYSLHLDNSSVIYDGIKFVKVEDLDLLPWLVFNKITATNIMPSDDVKGMFNYKATKATITHSVIKPFIVDINSEGDFGSIVGTFNLKDQKLHLVLSPSERFKNDSFMRQNFRKTEEGFIYESIIK